MERPRGGHEPTAQVKDERPEIVHSSAKKATSQLLRLRRALRIGCRIGRSALLRYCLSYVAVVCTFSPFAFTPDVVAV